MDRSGVKRIVLSIWFQGDRFGRYFAHALALTKNYNGITFDNTQAAFRLATFVAFSSVVIVVATASAIWALIAFDIGFCGVDHEDQSEGDANEYFHDCET